MGTFLSDSFLLRPEGRASKYNEQEYSLKGSTPLIRERCDDTKHQRSGRNVLAQLNEIATGGDKTVEKSPDDFIAWCQPGIPFDEVDFDFAVKGIGGGKDAEEDKLLTQQAFNFSQAVDFVPDVTGIYKEDNQQAVFRTSQARLSQMYGEILRLCRVVSTELTDKEKEKLDKFRKLMFEPRRTRSPTRRLQSRARSCAPTTRRWPSMSMKRWSTTRRGTPHKALLGQKARPRSPIGRTTRASFG